MAPLPQLGSFLTHSRQPAVDVRTTTGHSRGITEREKLQPPELNPDTCYVGMTFGSRENNGCRVNAGEWILRSSALSTLAKTSFLIPFWWEETLPQTLVNALLPFAAKSQAGKKNLAPNGPIAGQQHTWFFWRPTYLPVKGEARTESEGMPCQKHTAWRNRARLLNQTHSATR